MTLLSLQNNVPRYFIERYLGEGDLGVFAAVAYLTTVGAQVTMALGQSAGPRLAQYHAAGNRAAFRQLLVRLVGIGAALGGAGLAAAWIAGPQILAVLYRAEYAAHADLLVLLMLGAALSCMGGFLGAGITATRGFARLPIPYLLLTALVVACSALWIPGHGLAGAAWTSIVLGAGSCLVPLWLLILEPARTAVFHQRVDRAVARGERIGRLPRAAAPRPDVDRPPPPRRRDPAAPGHIPGLQLRTGADIHPQPLRGRLEA